MVRRAKSAAGQRRRSVVCAIRRATEDAACKALPPERARSRRERSPPVSIHGRRGRRRARSLARALLRVAAVQRRRRPRARGRSGCCRARGQAEEPLARDFAQVGDRVGPDEGIPDAAARERRTRAAQLDQPPVRLHGIVRLPSSPHLPSSPISSPASSIGTPGIVICIPTRRDAGRREGTTDAKRGVSWLPSSVQEWSTAATERRHGTPP